MNKILITGSSGTIGTRLAEYLLKQGHQVIGFDRKPNRWNQRIQDLTITGDLCQPEDKPHLPDTCDVVIHLAANARVYNLVVDPQLAFENIKSTFSILEYCRQKNIPQIIFASSREVYGNNLNQIQVDEKQIAIDSCESPYTASKISGEALVEAYRRCYGLKAIILRFSNVYGKYDLSDRIIPHYLRTALKGDNMVVYGLNKQLDFTYIDDTIQGISLCLERFKDVANQTFNIASGQGTPLVEVAQLIIDRLNSSSKVLVKDNRIGEILHYTADIQKAEKKSWIQTHNEYTGWNI